KPRQVPARPVASRTSATGPTPAAKPPARPEAPATRTATPNRPAAPRPPAAPAASSSAAAATAAGSPMEGKLKELGLTSAQVEGVLALSRDVIEQVVWEVVPDLAETIIREEIARLTAE
ncbi:MAG: response regulator, partial [Myxococcota bacterium]